MLRALYALVLTITLAASALCHADDQADVPVPTGASAPSDPDLKNKSWYRYTTKNFTVLSLDDGRGRYLAENLEKLKTWTYTRWGFPDQDFGRECRILCVPNRDLMKKLFGIEETRIETKAVENKAEVTVVWLLAEDKPSRVVAEPVTEVCLEEFERKYGVSVAWWAHRGMARLNGPLPDARLDLAYLGPAINSGKTVFPAETMFTTKAEEYKKRSAEDRQVFDREAAALCLLFRKEYGEARTHGFIRLAARNSPEDVLKGLLGFRSYQHFDTNFKRYMTDLSGDIIHGKTPDSYLEIVRAKRK